MSKLQKSSVTYVLPLGITSTDRIRLSATANVTNGAQYYVNALFSALCTSMALMFMCRNFFWKLHKEHKYDTVQTCLSFLYGYDDGVLVLNEL